MNLNTIRELDPIIHAPIRLAILSVLMASDGATFGFLRDAIETSDGNLSTHLTKLEVAGYVTINKSFVGKKPQTICAITELGRKSYLNYFNRLEEIVQNKGANTPI
ncbi:MAG: transcriptional regulator [Candidatus Neomarinimicrobiota bacterium]